MEDRFIQLLIVFLVFVVLAIFAKVAEMDKPFLSDKKEKNHGDTFRKR